MAAVARYGALAGCAASPIRFGLALQVRPLRLNLKPRHAVRQVYVGVTGRLMKLTRPDRDCAGLKQRRRTVGRAAKERPDGNQTLESGNSAC